MACPRAIGNTPVTAGSRVPPCPTLLILKTFLILFTQSCDVKHCGLSITKKPNGPSIFQCFHKNLDIECSCLPNLKI